MTTCMIPTYNNPLGAVRQIIRTIWDNANLEYILLPQNGTSKTTGPAIIDDPKEIQSFNPFTPLMPFNAASLVPDLINKGGLVAAVLRPCELRTLDGLIKYQGVNIEKILTICIDCLGTLPVDEFEWRAHRKGSPIGLTQEALKFAPQGGIVPYRYRAPCQICESPNAHQANINIGVLGLPVRKYFLMSILDTEVVQSIQFEDAIPLDKTLLLQHQRVVTRLITRGQETRHRIFESLVGVLPENTDAFMDLLHSCDDCRACLDNCPICTSEIPRRDNKGNFVREDVMKWLVSCSGCGMCEQNCPKHLPLTIIFRHIQQQLATLQ